MEFFNWCRPILKSMGENWNFRSNWFWNDNKLLVSKLIKISCIENKPASDRSLSHPSPSLPRPPPALTKQLTEYKYFPTWSVTDKVADNDRGRSRRYKYCNRRYRSVPCCAPPDNDSPPISWSQPRTALDPPVMKSARSGAPGAASHRPVTR